MNKFDPVIRVIWLLVGDHDVDVNAWPLVWKHMESDLRHCVLIEMTLSLIHIISQLMDIIIGDYLLCWSFARTVIENSFQWAYKF